jgi:hypothetical protein
MATTKPNLVDKTAVTEQAVAAEPVRSAVEQAAIDGAQVKTKSGTTHIETARAARLAAFKKQQ